MLWCCQLTVWPAQMDTWCTTQNKIDILYPTTKFDGTCLAFLDMATVEISIVTATVSFWGPRQMLFITCHMFQKLKKYLKQSLKWNFV
jgi:hypothetical protein